MKIIIAVHAKPPAIRKVYPILSVSLQDLTDQQAQQTIPNASIDRLVKMCQLSVACTRRHTGSSTPCSGAAHIHQQWRSAETVPLLQPPAESGGAPPLLWQPLAAAPEPGGTNGTMCDALLSATKQLLRKFCT